MDFRTLESLQKAIPVVLRHLGAYVDLAEQDFETAKAAAAVRLQRWVLLSVSAIFSLLLLCALVVALTWDGDHRVLAIGGMAGLFIAITVGSAVSLSKKQERAFESLRKEWREDRALLHGLLSRARENNTETG